MPSVIEKYLSTYAEKSAAPYREKLEGSVFDTCIVIPAFNESAYLDEALKSLKEAGRRSQLKVLCVVVVNHKTDTREELKILNRELYTKLLSSSETGFTVLPIDFVSEGKEFHPKEGVGDARKVGGDLVLWLYSQKRVLSPYFHCTDGDAVVAPDYFEIDWSADLSAQIADYTHIPSGDLELDKAHRLYEASLRHYEKGLHFAKSPYSFPTIGSLLTISFNHYAMVRGFPKRLAAEDFYILNKLAKVGRVEKRSTVVSLRARPSDRVPFGTGNGVAKILSEGIENFKTYNPEVFNCLKALLAQLQEFPEHRSTDRVKEKLKAQSFYPVLEEMDLWSVLEEANKSRPRNSDCTRHLAASFDAFKTRKFIHSVRDKYYPNLPLSCH